MDLQGAVTVPIKLQGLLVQCKERAKLGENVQREDHCWAWFPCLPLAWSRDEETEPQPRCIERPMTAAVHLETVKMSPVGSGVGEQGKFRLSTPKGEYEADPLETRDTH